MIKHASTRTTHTIELDDRDVHLTAGFLWEALDKLQTRKLDDHDAMRMITAATNLAKVLFEAAGLDFTKYTGSNTLKVTEK